MKDYLQVGGVPAVLLEVVQVKVVVEISLQRLLVLLVTHPSEQEEAPARAHRQGETRTGRRLHPTRIHPAPGPLLYTQQQGASFTSTPNKVSSECVMSHPAGRPPPSSGGTGPSGAFLYPRLFWLAAPSRQNYKNKTRIIDSAQGEHAQYHASNVLRTFIMAKCSCNYIRIDFDVS